MNAMSGKQRISAAFKRTFAAEKPQVDRIPAYLITAKIGLLNSYFGMALPLMSTSSNV